MHLSLRDTARIFRKLPNYVARFGILSGTRLLIEIEGGFRGETVNVPGMQAPVHLRHSVSDRSTFWQCLVKRQYDVDRFPHVERLNGIYKKMVDDGRSPLIIDCGANIGLSALVFATRFPDARIYAVEPDENNVAMLRRNTAHIATRVEILQGAIWHASRRLRIINPDAGSAAFRVDEAGPEEEGALRGYSIDEICALAGEPAPFIVKLDIEGAQRWLFSRNCDWVGRVHLLILELDDWLFPWQGTSRAFFSAVSRYPFEYLLGGENIFCFRDDSAVRDTFLGDGRPI